MRFLFLTVGACCPLFWRIGTTVSEGPVGPSLQGRLKMEESDSSETLVWFLSQYAVSVPRRAWHCRNVATNAVCESRSVLRIIAQCSSRPLIHVSCPQRASGVLSDHDYECLTRLNKDTGCMCLTAQSSLPPACAVVSSVVCRTCVIGVTNWKP